MTTKRFSLTLALVALLGSTAFAGAITETSSCARRHHETLALQPAVTATITADYLADRAALLQAALHQNAPATSEVAVAGRNATLAAAVVSAPASVQL